MKPLHQMKLRRPAYEWSVNWEYIVSTNPYINEWMANGKIHYNRPADMYNLPNNGKEKIEATQVPSTMYEWKFIYIPYERGVTSSCLEDIVTGQRIMNWLGKEHIEGIVNTWAWSKEWEVYTLKVFVWKGSMTLYQKAFEYLCYPDKISAAEMQPWYIYTLPWGGHIRYYGKGKAIRKRFQNGVEETEEIAWYVVRDYSMEVRSKLPRVVKQWEKVDIKKDLSIYTETDYKTNYGYTRWNRVVANYILEE